MEAQDSIQAVDHVEVSNTPAEIPSNMVRVRVISESGLFKNAKQYDKGSELVLEVNTAARFVSNGDVEYVNVQPEVQT